MPTCTRSICSSSKEHVTEREYWAKTARTTKLDHANAKLAAGQQPTQTEFETVKETLRKQISSDVLDNATSFEDFSDRLLQQYGITVKESQWAAQLPAIRQKRSLSEQTSR